MKEHDCAGLSSTLHSQNGRRSDTRAGRQPQLTASITSLVSLDRIARRPRSHLSVTSLVGFNRLPLIYAIEAGDCRSDAMRFTWRCDRRRRRRPSMYAAGPGVIAAELLEMWIYCGTVTH